MNTTKSSSKSSSKSWRDISPFAGKTDIQIKNMFKYLVGKQIFGQLHGDEIATKAYNNLMLELSLINTDYYTHIPIGNISQPSNREKDIDRVVDDLKSCVYSYVHRTQDKLLEITDTWASQHSLKLMCKLFDDEGKPCTKYPTNCSNPRFGATYAKTLKEYLTSRSLGFDKTCDQRGFIAEEYILSFLNTCFACPECKEVGYLAGCGGSSNGTVCGAYRDGVCLSCKEKGVTTLFEIKTRKESVMQTQTLKNGNLWLSGGDLVGLVSLLAHDVNVYMVALSRDTGLLRVGKVLDVKVNIKDFYAYDLQMLDRYAGSPRSKVMIKPQILSMSPMDQWLSKSDAKLTNKLALDIVLTEFILN